MHLMPASNVPTFIRQICRSFNGSTTALLAYFILASEKLPGSKCSLQKEVEPCFPRARRKNPMFPDIEVGKNKQI